MFVTEIIKKRAQLFDQVCLLWKQLFPSLLRLKRCIARLGCRAPILVKAAPLTFWIES